MLIDNLGKNNHKMRLISLIQQSDELLFASPFLTSDINRFLDELNLTSIKRLTLLTILKPHDEDQLYKIESLSKISAYCKQHKIHLDLFINNQLHGKVYLFKKNHILKNAIITSANFTDNGIENNLEWGVHISDTNDLNRLAKDVFLNPQNIMLTEEFLAKMNIQYQAIKRTLRPKKNRIPLNLISFIKADIPIIKSNIKYWLKPIGDKDNPVTEKWDFCDQYQDLNFSKIRPSGIHKNDIIITYGVGCGIILSVFKSISDEPYFSTEEEVAEAPWKERWPWSLEAENLCCKFAANCFKHNLKLNDLRSNFCKEYPQSFITAKKTNTFGRFNFGGDKLQLSPMFASFIIQKVFNLNI